MTKPKVFVSRIIPEKGLEMMQEFADIEVWQDELPPPYEVLLAKVKGMDGIVTLLTDQIDGNLMDTAGKSLKVISQMAVGFDNIVVPDATERGVPVGHTPGVLTDTTADFAFTLLASAARRVVEGVAYVRAEKWKTWGPTLLMGYDLWEATLGIVGFGRIGQAMAKRASGFNMRVLYADDYVDPAIGEALGAEKRSFEEVLAESDFVTLHVPLTQETKHLIGERALKQMKSSAILINTSRGPVVDPKALYTALKDGEIAYAALDVTDPEPILTDDPLLTLDNCVVVPHIASSSLATRTKMATMAAANLKAGLNGEKLPNCVNPEVQS